MAARSDQSRWAWVRAEIAAWAPVLVGLAIFCLLAAFMTMDPAPGITLSNGPFTDEGFNLLNARNFAVLGRWSTDDWNRQLITFPYTLIHAAVFKVAGPGVIQARLVEVATTAATAGVIVAGLRRVTAGGPAVLAGVAFGTSTLVLYYGRLALVEPLVGLGLASAMVLLAVGSNRRSALAGLLAGLALAAAIATKALAIPAVGGILGAALIMGWRDGPARRRALTSAATLAISAGIWVIIVLVPRRAELATALATLPAEGLPASLADALARITAYLRNGDGEIARMAPVLIAGLAGAGIGVTHRTHLEPAARNLLVIALACFVAGWVPLTLVPYVPNRYLVPLLPALALLAGLGVHALAVWHPRSTLILTAGSLILAGALSAPGLAAYGGWIRGGGSTLPGIQGRFAGLVPPGAPVQGDYAPVLAMRATGPIIFSILDANRGDLYAARGIRWLVLADGERPAWADLHEAAFGARRLVTSATWAGHDVGLYVLP